MISTDVKMIRILKTFAFILGGTSLIGILLLQKTAHSQPAQPGFEGSPKTLTNPFVNPGAGASGNNEDFFGDDEDFDDEGFAPPVRNAPTGGNRSFSVGGKPDDRDVPSPKRGQGGVEVGGGNPGGVISKNGLKPLNVDDETGLGSNDQITDFNFPDADIVDLAKTLGKLTGKNFMLDKDVKGKVTIISNSPITVGDAWKTFLTALDMNGFGLIPSGKFIRIARVRDARDKQIKTYTTGTSPDTDALVTRVFSLKYIGADEIARVFRSFSPPNSRVIPHEQTNTVIVTDTGSNIAKLAKMLDFLDVEGFDAGIEVVQVKYASAVELSKLIDTLLPGTGAGVGKRNAPGGGAFGGGRAGGSFAARRTKEGGLINTVISDERTNTLIVHANGKGAEQVRELVAKLDKRIPAPTGGGKIHVVYLQFADSEQISNTLNSFSQSARGAAGGGLPSTNSSGGIGVNPQQSTLFEGQIKVSPDKATNSLVITASPADFVVVQRVISKLDIPRDEIFAEVVIMEMLISKDFNYSSSFIAPNAGIGFTPNSDLAGFLSNPISQKGMVLGFKSGAAQTFTVAGQSVTVNSLNGLLKAIQTNTKTNVLATPQILTLDNTEATFESSERIPVPTVSQAQGGVISTGITRENVSVSITIKPQINKISSFVKMDIQAKLADISNRKVPTAVESLAFAILERTAKTSVVVGDSDTVVLGGLVRDKISDTSTKIPILGDIPLLGWLFKSHESSIEKSNLLIFITPQIVRQYEKVRAILDRKLKERDEYIEKFSGGDDPHRFVRDNMIKNLPDIKNISTYKGPRSNQLNDDSQPVDNIQDMGSDLNQPQDETVPAAAPVNQGTGAAPAPDAMLPASQLQDSAPNNNGLGNPTGN